MTVGEAAPCKRADNRCLPESWQVTSSVRRETITATGVAAHYALAARPARYAVERGDSQGPRS